ncbi:hypothetical protein RRG08_020013 [Elysia crispata]|uniref:Uncharacterized protein n=1 Tax=Elysia crispata TaxID=231223 RepID=A0AAE1BB63_9GAST|nr:hypothetical protein RRG08_020013 [Elysia crispata]
MTYLISTARSELALYGTGGKHIILKVVYLNQGRFALVETSQTSCFILNTQQMGWEKKSKVMHIGNFRSGRRC